MRYVLDFGSANTGGAPVFSVWANLDTLTPLPPPAIAEIGGGQYYFDWAWEASPAASVTFKATLNGAEQSDVISGSQGVQASSALPGTQGLAGFLTVTNILNRASVRLGMGKLGDDPFAVGNPVAESLIEGLTALGNNLLQYHWKHLERTVTIDTVAGQSLYAWPVDFYDLTGQTGWNRSSRLPMLGPVSPQEWQYIQAIQVGVVLNVVWRPRGNLIELGPTLPAPGTKLALEYASRYWLQSASSVTGPDKDAPTLSDDIVLIDGETMIAGVRLAWLEDKGFDTSAAQREFEEKLENALNVNTGGGRVLNMAGPRNLNPLISGDGNMPITRFGI